MARQPAISFSGMRQLGFGDACMKLWLVEVGSVFQQLTRAHAINLALSTYGKLVNGAVPLVTERKKNVESCN